MWKQPFFHFGFLFLVIMLSVRGFGPRPHVSQMTDGESAHGLEMPKELGRASAFLRDRWRRGIVITEWLMEYNTSRWEISNASTPAEIDLLEARFHVDNAEAFTQAISESDRAVKELAQADTSIQAVENLVAPGLAPQLKIIDDEIAAAETSEKAESASATVPFDAIKANLDHLIAIVRSSRTRATVG